MDVGDFQLRFCRLRHVGEEGDEIAVFRFCLGQRSRSTLRVPGIRHRQLGARQVLRIRISIDHGLKSDAGHFEAIVLHGVHGAVKQDLV